MVKKATAKDFSDETLTLAFESSNLAKHLREKYLTRLTEAAFKVLWRTIKIEIESED